MKNRKRSEDLGKYLKQDKRMKYPKCFVEPTVTTSKHGAFVDIKVTTFLDKSGRILLVSKSFELNIGKLLKEFRK